MLVETLLVKHSGEQLGGKVGVQLGLLSWDDSALGEVTVALCGVFCFISSFRILEGVHLVDH